MSAHSPQFDVERIRSGIFRANPRYELVAFDRLRPEQQLLFSELQKDSDLFGILIPQPGSGLSYKSVCRETALLFYSMQQPGTIPSSAARSGEIEQIAGTMVLDSILEISREDHFVAGADAYDVVCKPRPKTQVVGRIAQLSSAAIRYASLLDHTDITKLSARMYFFNRIPITPKYAQRFPDPDAVADFLGLRDGSAVARTLARDWMAASETRQTEGWRVWQFRECADKTAAPRFKYKLYVSPHVDELKSTFPVIVKTLTETRAPHFKFGVDAAGILRPDKIVVYFSAVDHLQETAGRLKTELSGCPAQAVPFTAELTECGLLSWGMDPPSESQILSWQERLSWRLWVTNQLAMGLLAAREMSSTSMTAADFAIHRLRHLGVDPETWSPAASIWAGDDGYR